MFTLLCVQVTFSFFDTDLYTNLYELNSVSNSKGLAIYYNLSALYGKLFIKNFRRKRYILTVSLQIFLFPAASYLRGECSCLLSWSSVSESESEGCTASSVPTSDRDRSNDMTESDDDGTMQSSLFWVSKYFSDLKEVRLFAVCRIWLAISFRCRVARKTLIFLFMRSDF